MKISTALLSVSDKRGIVEFARGLSGLGIRILSTGGTAKVLREAGIALTEVSEHTGAPEILDGRVKTLHPRVHGGILAVRDNPDHQRQMREQGIEPIDLVAVNLYPFGLAARRIGATEEEIIENIDIGGPSMIRSAAKNHRFVTVVSDPEDYPRVQEEMKRCDGATSEELRRELAVKAFALTARYDGLIAGHFSGGGEFPPVLTLQWQKVSDLRYGENPHQRGAWYRYRGDVPAARVLGGKELSYNNLLDLDSAQALASDFSEPGAVVVKHNNPCGAACDPVLSVAFHKAREGDPVSAYGGVLAFNRPVDSGTAEAVAEKGNFFEAVIAPGYEPAALEILQSKPKWGKNLRIVEYDGAIERTKMGHALRSISGGLLVQSADDGVVAEWKVLTGETSDAVQNDLRFAMTVCKHVRSNAIVIAQGRTVVGVGAGQMSRLDSAEIAVRKAGARAGGAVAASDAFFPFPDALEVLARAGVTAVIHPGGSIRDAEVEAAARKAGVALVASGMRHFRH